LVKKELSQATACTISFKTLSIYEDRVPSQVSFGKGEKKDEFNQEICQHCFDNFWVKNNSKIVVDFDPTWHFLILKCKGNGTLWAVCYLKVLILSYLKRVKRLGLQLFQRSAS